MNKLSCTNSMPFDTRQLWNWKNTEQHFWNNLSARSPPRHAQSSRKYGGISGKHRKRKSFASPSAATLCCTLSYTGFRERQRFKKKKIRWILFILIVLFISPNVWLLIFKTKEVCYLKRMQNEIKLFCLKEFEKKKRQSQLKWFAHVNAYDNRFWITQMIHFPFCARARVLTDSEKKGTYIGNWAKTQVQTNRNFSE